MFKFFRKATGKANFDRKVLRRNDISLLILDERWSSLFENTEKTADIAKCEEKIKELLKEQARLISETKGNAVLKKKCMDSILQLTTEVYENNNEAAKIEMQQCEKEIVRVNYRNSAIEKKLEEIPERIKQANIELLEHTVNIVYFRIRSNQKRVAELEKLIEDMKMKLKAFIDEKETLSQGDNDIYSYFHDLLGPEELERLDKEFFGSVNT